MENVEDSTPAAGPSANPVARADFSKIRHELRTPINHILGYCEMLREEEALSPALSEHLQRIHNGGRKLFALINDYFDEERLGGAEEARLDLTLVSRGLRAPVDEILSCCELLRREAAAVDLQTFVQDLEKIHQAAATWLSLMETYLLPAPGAPVPASAPPPELFEIELRFEFPSASPALGNLPMKASILVVDDDAATRDLLARRLRRYGSETTLAENGLEALRLVRTQPFDLVLLNMIMPGMDGFQVLAKIKEDPALRHIPVLMISALDQDDGIARCIEMGAEDYLAKPLNPVLLRARIGACLEKKLLRDRERQTLEALLSSQKHLASELAEAAAYVKSLLPRPLTGPGPVATQWCFQPSSELGGDAFGYHWVDSTRFAIYLLDVCGHGVGAALLSMSAINVLRSQSLPETDFLDPSAVLAGLNRTFRMENQNNMYFTIWYGVFDATARTLRYASGGHPPAIALTGATAWRAVPLALRTKGPAIGCLEEAEFSNNSIPLDSFAQLYVLSDGVYEISLPDGKLWTLNECMQRLIDQRDPSLSPEEHLRFVQTLRGSDSLEDDFSLLQIHFAPPALRASDPTHP